MLCHLLVSAIFAHAALFSPFSPIYVDFALGEPDPMARSGSITQGARCGARRKDGDGYDSLTIDRDNTHLLTSVPHKSHFHLDKQFVRVV